MSNPTVIRVPPLWPSRQELRDISSRNCSHQPELKFLWRKDWLCLEPYHGSWVIKDLWGDYELLFGASKLHPDIVETPVHHQERVHGVTKMTKIISNGWRMLRICWHAWLRLGG